MIVRKCTTCGHVFEKNVMDDSGCPACEAGSDRLTTLLELHTAEAIEEFHAGEGRWADVYNQLSPAPESLVRSEEDDE